LDPDGVRDLIQKYEKFTLGIKRNALQYSWYMRGGVTYEDILNMSENERTAIKEIIDANIETTKKTQLPFF